MKYDDQYFFIRKDEENKRLPLLKADTNTAARNYWFEPQPLTSTPLIFSNAWRERFREEGIKEQIPSIIFEGSNFVVGQAVRQQLLALDIPSLHLHPAIYIDDADHWHEGLWYVSFTEQFACWHRTRSTFLPRSVNVGSKRSYAILTFSLDEDLLDRTPLGKRLMFQMGDTTTDLIACHQSVIGLFSQGGKSGAILEPITEY